MTPLPTPRTLLTSLVTTLTSISPPPAPASTHQSDPPPNPLHSLPPQARALLTTLHVLIPPPTLLQALDLLDRGLVTLVICSSSPSDTKQNIEATEEDHSPRENFENFEPSAGGKKDANEIFLVRSSQQPKSRYSTGDGGGMSYIVRLQAWNCSCAAFAFASFPASTTFYPSYSSVSLFDLDVDVEDGAEEGDEQSIRTGRDDWIGGAEEEKWEFGGSSNDGKDGGNGGVPCCKHLLACLLGERWKGVLGGYVKERVVGREEMAGLGGEH